MARLTDATFRAAEKIYNAMLEESEDRTWAGHTTQLFQENGMSTGRYSAVMKALIAMGCVVQTKRGGGPELSEWRLVYPPDIDKYNELRESGDIGGMSRMGQAEGGLKEMATKISKMEKQLAELTMIVKGLVEDHG